MGNDNQDRKKHRIFIFYIVFENDTFMAIPARNKKEAEEIAMSVMEEHTGMDRSLLISVKKVEWCQ